MNPKQLNFAGDSLINFGGNLKTLGEGRIGGELVIFGSKDLSGDVFTKNTDFGFKDGDETPIYLNHRLPLKTRDGQFVTVKEKIGIGTLKMTDDAVLIDAILYNREQYEKALDAMGWSSGTAAHLMEREVKDGVTWVKTWPLKLDASITPIPCEPSTKVVSLKSYLDSLEVEPPPFAVKGLLANELAKRKQSAYDIWYGLTMVIEKIAEAAESATELNLTGAPLDVRALVAEAVNEFGPLFIETAVAQINEYARGESDQEHFWLKSLDHLGALVSGAPLLDHSDAVVSAVEEYANQSNALKAALAAYTQRINDKQKFRAETKAGRVISQANRDRMGAACAKIKDAMDAMQGVHDDLDSLVVSTSPKSNEPDDEMQKSLARKAVAEYLFLQQRQWAA